MRAVMTSKGQVTIPIEIRQRLGLDAGQVLEFDEHAPYLKAIKAFDPDAMDGVLGRFREELKGATPESWLKSTRGAVDVPPRPSAANEDGG
jgi:AbrB family looped-hinge helix DNA binding protein